VAAAPAGEERDLGEIGEDGDAVGALQQSVGDHLIARVAQLLQHLTGDEQTPFLARGLRLNGGGDAEQGESSQQRDERGAHAHVVPLRLSPLDDSDEKAVAADRGA
jgi:hypothetical protein